MDINKVRECKSHAGMISNPIIRHPIKTVAYAIAVGILLGTAFYAVKNNLNIKMRFKLLKKIASWIAPQLIQPEAVRFEQKEPVGLESTYILEGSVKQEADKKKTAEESLVPENLVSEECFEEGASCPNPQAVTQEAVSQINDASGDLFNQIGVTVKELIELKNLSSSKENDYIYEGELKEEKDEINTLLSVHENKAIIEVINNTSYANRDAYAALWVVLGIKPIAVFESDIDSQVKKLILNILKLEVYKDKLTFIEKNRNPKYVFTNKQPLEVFKPGHYLKESDSISNAVNYFFCRNSTGITVEQLFYSEQVLAYLLGFGPTWEAYYVRSILLGNGIINPALSTESSVFSDNHYFEIGKSLKSLMPKFASLNEVDIGKAYHLKTSEIIEKLSRIMREKYESKKKSDPNLNWISYLCSCDPGSNLDMFGIESVFDGISGNTDYFKKSHTLRQWVISNYIQSIKL